MDGIEIENKEQAKGKTVPASGEKILLAVISKNIVHFEARADEEHRNEVIAKGKKEAYWYAAFELALTKERFLQQDVECR